MSWRIGVRVLAYAPCTISGALMIVSRQLGTISVPFGLIFLCLGLGSALADVAPLTRSPETWEQRGRKLATWPVLAIMLGGLATMVAAGVIRASLEDSIGLISSLATVAAAALVGVLLLA